MNNNRHKFKTRWPVYRIAYDQMNFKIYFKINLTNLKLVMDMIDLELVIDTTIKLLVIIIMVKVTKKQVVELIF
jgi:hypothetical protein